MSAKTIAQKLSLKPGYVLSLVNAPEDYLTTIGDITEKVTDYMEIAPNSDVIQFFTKTKSELQSAYPLLKDTLNPGGSIWVIYPKGSSGVETDLKRDNIWQIDKVYKLHPAALLSVDDVWAALRMRPT